MVLKLDFSCIEGTVAIGFALIAMWILPDYPYTTKVSYVVVTSNATHMRKTLGFSHYF
ncbi:hypothetical protein LX32DRAFT_690892 [Colletotrichum zoysiae]|uniref:Uncharacterized protein n=1 Tax=Colletotrichum zoysiae TaxID=1216348 RepID=A0AAD9M7S7_9PEZI|nr:hypothetical protein LX32DRAFT_690892 [Colletotrichum zoysiae]